MIHHWIRFAGSSDVHYCQKMEPPGKSSARRTRLLSDKAERTEDAVITSMSLFGLQKNLYIAIHVGMTFELCQNDFHIQKHYFILYTSVKIDAHETRRQMINLITYTKLRVLKTSTNTLDPLISNSFRHNLLSKPRNYIDGAPNPNIAAMKPAQTKQVSCPLPDTPLTTVHCPLSTYLQLSKL